MLSGFSERPVISSLKSNLYMTDRDYYLALLLVLTTGSYSSCIPAPANVTALSIGVRNTE